MDVKISSHSSAPPPVAKQYGGSVAMALAVDQRSATQTDVYLAMGHDGLMRVRFTDTGGGLHKNKSWGPIFGTGSAYEVEPPPVSGGGSPPQTTRDLYGNLILEQVRSYLPLGSQVTREERPFFTDVALLDTTIAGHPAHQLYVAVDHLYWLVFDLNQPWSADQDILHHAGTQFYLQASNGTATALRGTPVMGADANQNAASCARTIRVLDDPQGAYVVVGNSFTFFIRDYSDTRAEACSYDADLMWGGGPVDEVPIKRDTQVFKVDWDAAAGAFTWSQVGQFDGGGENVCAPATQELLPGRIKFFYQFDADPDPDVVDRGMGLALLDVQGGSNTQTFQRGKDWAVGKLCFSVGTSPAHPDLVLTADNDGGLPNSGMFVIEQDQASGAWDLKSLYNPPAGSTTDDRGPEGLLWTHPESATVVEGQELVLTSGGKNANGDKRWLYAKYSGVTDNSYRTVDNIARSEWYYLEPPNDRFNNSGRVFYESLDLLSRLNTANKPMVGAHIQTTEGVAWFWRTDLEAYIATNGVANGEDIKVGSLAHVIRLVTHPEFNLLPTTGNDKVPVRHWWNHKGCHDDDVSLIGSNNPILIDVPKGTEWGHYVLAVPCRRLSANPDWNIFDSNWTPNNCNWSMHGKADWLPPTGSILRDWFGHGLVQFWEIAVDAGGNYYPVTTTENGVPGNTTLSRLIFPDGPVAGGPRSSCLVVESVTIDNTVYLLAADVAGHLYVYDITSILSLTDPTMNIGASPLATWDTVDPTFDGLPNPLFDIAVDYENGDTAMLYLAERRAGFEVLQFDPKQVLGGNILTDKGLVQTPGECQGVAITTLGSGEKKLLVADLSGGIRMYGKQ